MTIMSRPYNDESRNEYDRIFGHGEYDPKDIKLISWGITINEDNDSNQSDKMFNERLDGKVRPMPGMFGDKQKLKFTRVDGSTIEIDVNEITEEPKDISTFDDKNRVLIVCGDDSMIVNGSYSEIYNAWREVNHEKQKNI